MVEPYPEIEPYEQGMLDVGDGHRVYWEVCGNPGGKPAVVLHGGPGSGCTPGSRRSFDPTRYRIVLFDQRNAGRSTPHGSNPAVDLSTNTTEHLIADIELLREHLGIDRWLVWGGSWGATLALAYAQRHPQRVSEIVLASVTMTRPADIDWLYHGVGRFFPEQWSRFRDGVPRADRDGDLVAAYYRLLNDPDLAVREKAARDWCDWEDAVVSLEPGYRRNPRYDDPHFRIAFARIVTHYFHHRAWLPDGILLREAHRLAGIPGVLVHGRLDLSGPSLTAWQLAQAWPDAHLHLVGTGHTGGGDMTTRVIQATDRFARVAGGSVN
ncbi:MAG: prolyl aminopeptidase [Pseudonocardiales bacterium]|nr:prolyl aminopeptidase [Pseudonocardiales bacterium]